MGFCFVHAADLHLDTPFEGVGSASPLVAEALREASLEAFDELVRIAVGKRAAFLVVAGDIYDGVERGIRAQLRFLGGLRRLSDAGVAVFVAHGNHDPVGGWPGVREWPPGVRVFGTEEVETFPVERDGELLARVSGISYGRRDMGENLAARFPAPAGEVPSIAVLHCNVGGDPSHAPYSPCTLDDLARAGHDYWALGHIHRHAVLRAGRPWVVYPGGTQGRSMKPSERGAKGACVVHVESGRVREVEHVPVDRVRFALLELDAAGSSDLGRLRAALCAAAEDARAGADGRALVVRAVVRGRGPVHADLGCGGGVDGLLLDLRDEFEGERPFLWWESVRDATRPDLDLDGLRGRGDFSAAVVERADAVLAPGGAPDPGGGADPGGADPGGGAGPGGDSDPVGFVTRVVAAAAPRRVVPFLRPPGVGEAETLVEEARALALDLLEDEADACG